MREREKTSQPHKARTIKKVKKDIEKKRTNEQEKESI